MSNILISNNQNIILSQDLSQDILNTLKTFFIELYKEELDKIIL